MTQDPAAIAGKLSAARLAFVDWLRSECSDEAADCREDDIINGLDDRDLFIVGYMSAVRQSILEEQARGE